MRGNQNGDFHVSHLKEEVTEHEKEALSKERIEDLFPEMTRILGFSQSVSRLIYFS